MNKALLKLANAPGTVPLKVVRQLVNKTMAARRAVQRSGTVIPPNGRFLPEPLVDKIQSVFPAITPIDSHTIDFYLHQGIKNMPARRIYRGTGLPDMSAGGHTSSAVVRNAGPNIRHVSPDFESASGYGRLGLVEVYNARNVPGLLNGRLRFGTNRFVEGVTDNFSDFGALFDKNLSRQSANNIGRARRRVLDTRRLDLNQVPRFRGALDPGFDDLMRAQGETDKARFVRKLNAKRDAMLDEWHKAFHDPAAELGYESAIDTARTLPSRTFQVGLRDVVDVSALQEYARRQKQLLPEGFNLNNLTSNGVPANGLTKSQRKAAERYQAVYDILLSLMHR